MKPEVIQALTPWFLAAVAFMLASLAAITPNLPVEVRVTIITLAGNALGGASGLGQQNKQSTIKDSEIQSVNLTSSQTPTN